ncbi:hypothetical protein [Halobacterium yunchengense]|uniref:hypothetical protein n=1 Tax=Halobacterium yunchengense TaxID=3108497 RepID=UPI0030080A27
MRLTPPDSGRTALLAVGLSVLLVTAGCTGFIGGEGSGSGDGAATERVPADASMVGYVDAAGMLEDDSLRDLANAAFEAQGQSEFYSGPTSVEEWLTQVEDESGLDPSNVESMTFYGTEGESVPTNAQQAGAVIETSFTEDEIVSAMEESGTEFAEESHQDTTVYTYGYQNQNALAALGDGAFVVGDTTAVESVLDVDAGDEEALGGELLAQFESTDDGYLRFAADVPQDQLPADELGGNSQVDTSAFNAVTYVSGSFDTSGDEVSMRMNMISESSDDASRINDVVDGALSLYSGVGGDELREALEKLSVSQDGDTVTVTYTDTVDELEDRIEAMYSMSGSASATGSASSSTDATDGAATTA